MKNHNGILEKLCEKMLKQNEVKSNESGSLIIAIIVIFVTMLLSLVLIGDIMQTQEIAINGKHITGSIEQSNAAISDAFYQLNQFGTQSGTELDQLPSTFCAYAGNLLSSNIPNECVYEGTVSSGGHSGWVYVATLQPNSVQTENLKTYLIVATGYSTNGVAHKSQEFDQIAVINAALAMPAGFVINGKGATVVPTDSSGNIQDSILPSVSVNEGAASCGAINFYDNQGYINVYGKSSSTTTGCQGSLTGTPMLNQQPAQNTLCSNLSISTIPATACLPAPTYNSSGQVTNYVPGCAPPGSPESYSCCPPGGVFTGEVNPGIYLCNEAITIDAPLYVNNGGSCTKADNLSANNSGKVQIFDFIPSSIAAGDQDVTFGNNGGGDGINQYPVPSASCGGNPVSGDANNFQLYISNPGNPAGLCNSSNYSTGDFGNIYSAVHGSNVPAIVAELDAPNDTFNINGAPFTSWTGNMYTCYADFNGSGSSMIINDNVLYSQMTSPWSSYGYQDI